MTSVSICSECKGKGTYKIYNAYDPNFEEEIICEYCEGEGTFEQAPIFRKVKRGQFEDDWVN